VVRIGVVLGAGGSVGLAYHGGVLAALAEGTGWDPRQAELLVGTSAGALSAALLRLGMPATDLRQVTESLPLSPEGAALAEIGAPHRPRVRLGDFLRPRPPGDLVGALRGVLSPWSRNPLATVAAALPEGPVDTGPISQGLDQLADGRWPSAPLWVNAVRLRDGRRVTFGRDGAPAAELGLAVAASCAIPAYFRPVRIGPDRYVDGATRSVHGLDLLTGCGLDVVVVSAPMAHAGRRAPIGADAAMRAVVRAQLQREAAKVRAGGTRVVLLAPTRPVLVAMGLDPMDARRRALVSRLARRSTLDALAPAGLAELLGVAPEAAGGRRNPAA
jgi:NTE family protein